MPRVNYFAVPADVPERAINFYQEVFGWQFEIGWEYETPQGREKYWHVTTDDGSSAGINGGLTRREYPGQSISVGIEVPAVDVCAGDTKPDELNLERAARPIPLLRESFDWGMFSSLSRRGMSDGLSPALSTRNSRTSSPQLKPTSISHLVRVARNCTSHLVDAPLEPSRPVRHLMRCQGNASAGRNKTDNLLM
jgi:hypothetical protein